MWIQLLKTTSCRCIQQNYTVLEIVVLHFIFTHIYYIQNTQLRMKEGSRSAIVGVLREHVMGRLQENPLH